MFYFVRVRMLLTCDVYKVDTFNVNVPEAAVHVTKLLICATLEKSKEHALRRYLPENIQKGLRP